ncbi:transporter substrate-binding domain-containing protein [Micromonospora sp. R77]|uniref:transporter substrate-binding domain-containing protein n=1 Tax=Micromonospora sp. R77 TaxID=2925836 RepID=UPI001F625B6E|nr:transporter substrate-binding domain-containing protein [Micromonospora sp. R77]MCI4065973.1 transporter substrate-binding domain-containing protein [Micromonospora sp. R77]
MRIRPTVGWLAAVVLLAVAGCSATSGSTAAPPALPAAVTSTPTTAARTGGFCTVRHSYPPSAVPPGRVLTRGKLVAGVDPSDATMSHWDATAQRFEGFNIDLVLAVAKAIWPDRDPRSMTEFRAVRPGQGAFDALVGDDPVDVIATSLTASCRRAQDVVFSNDYLDSGQTALVRRVGDGPEYAGVDDLAGRRVCAAAGTTSLETVASYRTRDGGRLVPVQAENVIDCLVMLRQHQVDAVSTDENILIGFARMAPDTALVTAPPADNAAFCTYHVASAQQPCTWLTDEPHAFAFAKGEVELVAFVNHVLAPAGPAGQRVWQQAHQRWLPDHPDRGMPSPGTPVTSWPPA